MIEFVIEVVAGESSSRTRATGIRFAVIAGSDGLPASAPVITLTVPLVASTHTMS